jgi:glycine/D-amino acid oxidase-like deaminating enzyme/nitrite reductase/ring-hydroxylating ferredoxin subunit
MLKHNSFWLASHKTTSYPVFKKPLSIDIAVIGAGITGANCAYLLTKAGYKVAVIEAGKIGHGVSGHTTGKITSQHNLIYSFLLENFGKEKAKKYFQANEKAISMYKEVIEVENILCDFEDRDAYVYAAKKEDEKDILKEFEANKKMGIDSETTKNLPLPFKTYGAIKFKNQAQFHPVKYIDAILKKVKEKNGYIFENTKAVDVTEGNPCIVKTDQGSLKAKHVILATHFPFLDQKSKYFAKMRQKKSHIVAIKTKESISNGMYISSEENFKSFRNQPNDLILIGGERHTPGDGASTLEKFKKLDNYAKSIFNVKESQYVWSTQDNITIDRIPYIGKLDKGSKSIYVATGFGGWGMTTGMVAAMILTDIIKGVKNPWADVFNPHRRRSIKFQTELLAQGMGTAKKFLRGKMGMKSLKELKLEKGEGKIVNFQGQKIAVYKSTSGKILTFKPWCTHMGCLLSWNDGEKSWDCPCHGSRFKYNGKNIQGPAVKNLEKTKIK